MEHSRSIPDLHAANYPENWLCKPADQAKREAGPIIRMAVMISRKSVIMGSLLATSFAGIKRQGAIKLHPRP
ncbi:hypothetical protein CK815_16740 [Brucella abortus]|nr:hypothetical protein CK815_01510 [Brucella abortus]ATA41876.1 hypothetical protein CK815_16740 [Brucella abortus]